MLLTSEWPPDNLGGVGRYVAEVGNRIAAVIGVDVALVPTYFDLDGAVFRINDPQRVSFNWSRYRKAIRQFGVGFDYRDLSEAAKNISMHCADVMRIESSPTTVFVQDYFLAPIAQSLRDLGIADRVVSFSHMPVHAGFTYFDKPVADQVHQVLEAQLVRISDKVVAPSEFAANALTVVHSVPKEKVVVIPLGVNRPTEVKTAIAGIPRFAFVGRPNEQKGQHFLFAAIQILKLTFPDVRVSVVSGAGSTSRIRKLAADYDVLGQVDFVPELQHDEVWAFLDGHHCLVTTSIYETFGLAVLEAMASSRPTIGFPIGGLSELWGRQLTKVFATPLGDSAALARRMQKLVDTPGLFEEYGDAARIRANEFSWSAHVQKLLPLLTS